MFERGLTYTGTITMITETCCNCGILFGMTSDLNKRLRNNHELFYCPAGHSQHYTGKSDAQKLKDLQTQLEQKQKDVDFQKRMREYSESELKKVRTKLERVHKGVCPCCNRSFENLRRHMETKHPEELKGFIALINNPNNTTTENSKVAKEKGVVFLTQLTASEKKKLKQK